MSSIDFDKHAQHKVYNEIKLVHYTVYSVSPRKLHLTHGTVDRDPFNRRLD